MQKVIKYTFYIALMVLYGSCVRRDCNYTPRTETTAIRFKLKDKTTGVNIIIKSINNNAAPDSIQLKNIKTGQMYSLKIDLWQNESTFYSQYIRPANISDSLEFKFGSSIPDTLVVHTGIVDGWRGDECGSVDDAGIVKVTLRGQTLPISNADDIFFTIIK